MKEKSKAGGMLTVLDRGLKWVAIIAITWLIEQQVLPMLVSIFKKVTDMHNDVELLTKKVDGIILKDSIYFSLHTQRVNQMQDAIDINYKIANTNTEAIRDNTITIGMIQTRLNAFEYKMLNKP